MSAVQSFRSAFRGFNREDVAHYLEYWNAKHAAQVNQLTAEAEQLRAQLAAVPEQSDDTARCEELGTQVESLTQERNTLAQELSDMRTENEALTEKIKELEAALAESRNQQTVEEHRQTQELEAYRRAERAERMAQERAEQVYRRTNGVLADAAAKVDEAAGQLSTVSEHVLSQIDLLQSAVNSSKDALREAADGLYRLRPQGEDEKE